MSGRERKRLSAVARGLDIPAPFDLGEFTTQLASRRNRPIRLRPFTAGAGMPSGLWIGTPTADYVYYEQGTTPFHGVHIALHEIAHMLLGHRGPQGWLVLASQLAPDVHPSLARLILGRFGYGEPEEREAETLASLILARASARPRSRYGSSPHAALRDAAPVMSPTSLAASPAWRLTG